MSTPESPPPLRVLAAGASPAWRAALSAELARAGIAAELVAVAGAGEFTAALRGGHFTAALTDGIALPAPAAAEILRTVRLQPPLILFADAPGEEAVAAALRAGAADFVPVRNPERLGRALREAITAREARHTEQEAATHYRLLVEDAQVGIYLIQQNRIIYANPRLAEVFGYSREELFALPHLEQLVAPEDRDLVAQNIRRRERGEVRTLRYGFRGRRRDGQAVEVEVFGVATRVAGEAAILGTLLDVTAQRRAERELQQSVAVLRAVLEGSSEGMLALNRDGSILAKNRRFAELWKIPEEINASGNDAAVFERVLAQLASPGEFMRGFSAIGAGEPAPPPAQLWLKSGRILERSARHFDVRGVSEGQVYSFREVTEELRLADELRRSEARLRAVLQHASDIITLIDRDGKILYESPVIGRILGYGTDELSGQPVFGYLHPDDQTRAQQNLAALVAAPGETRTVSLRFRRKDGNWAWLESIAVNRLADPEIGAIVISSRDITERMRIETALRDSEVRFKLFMDNFPGPAFIKDDAGRLLYVNNSYARFCGATADDLIGRTDRDIFGEEAGSRMRAQDEQVLANGEPVRRRDLLQSADGEARALTILKFPLVLTPSKRLLGGIAFDISEREQMASALRDSEERFRLFMDNNPALAFIKDDHGIYTYVNRPFETFFGQRPGEWLGRSDEDLLPDAIAAQYRANDAEVLATGEAREFHETSTDLQGRVHSSLVLKFPLRDAAGSRYVGGLALDITERMAGEALLRQQREALAEQTAQLNAILENIPSMIFVKDAAALKFVRFNRAGEALLGIPRTEILGKSDHDFFPREEADFFIGKDREVLAGGGLRDIPEESIHTRAHGVRWLHTRKIPIHDEAGAPLYLLGISEDITERKRTEAALQQSEARLGSLVRNSYDLITLLNPRGEMLYHSPALERIISFPPEELAGRALTEFVHPDDREPLLAKMTELAEHPDRRLQAIWRCRHKSGQWVWLESVGTNLLADPAVGALVVNSRDITERRAAEEGLARALQRLRLHIENAPLAVIEWSREGRVSAWNPAAERMFGYAAHEAAGRDAEFIATDASRAQIAGMFAQLLRREGSGDSPVLEHRAADGRLLQCRWFNTPLINREGEVFAIASLIQDVSELNRTRRELEEFIFTTAHDLKAPLLSVKAFAEIAARAAAGQDALAAPLDRLMGNARRMESLVSGVLEYARLGYRERREEWIALEPATRALLAAAVPSDDDTLIELAGRDRPAHELLMDPRDYERIMSNLISNARNYRDPRRRLRLTLGLRKGADAFAGYHAISVADNGAGISPDQHQYIFRLFTRLAGDGAEGHGLGLAVVKRLTEDYGGRVTVESLAEGTRFDLWLPVSRFRRMSTV